MINYPFIPEAPSQSGGVRVGDLIMSTDTSYRIDDMNIYPLVPCDGSKVDTNNLPILASRLNSVVEIPSKIAIDYTDTSFLAVNGCVVENTAWWVGSTHDNASLKIYANNTQKYSLTLTGAGIDIVTSKTGQYIYALFKTLGYYALVVSNDYGSTWTLNNVGSPVGSGLDTKYGVYAKLACTEDGSEVMVFFQTTSSNWKLIRSVNYGVTFIDVVTMTGLAMGEGYVNSAYLNIDSLSCCVIESASGTRKTFYYDGISTSLISEASNSTNVLLCCNNSKVYKLEYFKSYKNNFTSIYEGVGSSWYKVKDLQLTRDWYTLDLEDATAPVEIFSMSQVGGNILIHRILDISNSTAPNKEELVTFCVTIQDEHKQVSELLKRSILMNGTLSLSEKVQLVNGEYIVTVLVGNESVTQPNALLSTALVTSIVANSGRVPYLIDQPYLKMVGDLPQ